MSPDQKKSTTGAAGGNTPKARPQSAKDASRAQSSPVTGGAARGKSGNPPKPGTGKGKGGNVAKPGKQPSPAARRGPSGTLLAWSTVGLVVIVIAVLVILKATGGSSTNTTYTPVTPAPAAIVRDVTTIPASVYNSVGVNIPAVATPSPPIVLSKQPPLTLGGKSPAMFYYGAEYCPFCAAERWGIVAALSRFGTFSGLKVTASSLTDPAGPDTRTFSFYGSTYTSKYISFFPVEQYTNIPNSNGYTLLQNPTKAEQAVANTYSNPKYIPGAIAGQIGFPFIDIGNVALVSGATYTPKLLSGLSHANIAGGLTDPTNPVTQAIVGTANYITAAICATTKGNPGSVCQSRGVQSAASALKLS